MCMCAYTHANHVYKTTLGILTAADLLQVLISIPVDANSLFLTSIRHGRDPSAKSSVVAQVSSSTHIIFTLLPKVGPFNDIGTFTKDRLLANPLAHLNRAVRSLCSSLTWQECLVRSCLFCAISISPRITEIIEWWGQAILTVKIIAHVTVHVAAQPFNLVANTSSLNISAPHRSMEMHL